PIFPAVSLLPYSVWTQDHFPSELPTLSSINDYCGRLPSDGLIQLQRRPAAERMRPILNDIDRAVRVRRLVVQRRRHAAMDEGEHAGDEFHRAAARAEIAEIAFERGDRHSAERLLNGLGLCTVLLERPFAVGVDVANVARLEFCGGQ